MRILQALRLASPTMKNTVWVASFQFRGFSVQIDYDPNLSMYVWTALDADGEFVESGTGEDVYDAHREAIIYLADKQLTYLD